ncbi:polyphosphate kinase 2 (plasmid) [Burkholderia thailandensis]|uniref:polyphosphate kinase 2 n=1 Tax=Burkholderia thailandensis TaxID=57975 RepID=UPI00192DC9E7|nr:polyphosphate kinase 2 [Burkholderia thailandensis]MBS2132186.1 polyphosphate kinase 2 [Burkholderia thailandensis]QRA15283.1 polyphosphate kinase 2 [Burkholderia thailandensis]
MSTKHARAPAIRGQSDEDNPPPDLESISHDAYEKELYRLQVELVKLQRHFIRCRDKILVLLEGRDAAGKDGAIKRIVEHLSPRETRVVALGRPSDRDLGAWYFQRYVPHLPVAEELVLFNRSWYNRAGVEHVMGFCTPQQLEEFLQSVPRFEAMLVESGIRLLKYYLDIERSEQVKRLESRKHDPLKAWKISPIDEVAVKHWKAYSKARDTMLLRTHTPIAPWRIVRADDKKLARLNLIRDILSRLDYCDKDESLLQRDIAVVFEFEPACLANGLLAK